MPDKNKSSYWKLQGLARVFSGKVSFVETESQDEDATRESRTSWLKSA